MRKNLRKPALKNCCFIARNQTEVGKRNNDSQSNLAVGGIAGI